MRKSKNRNRYVARSKRVDGPYPGTVATEAESGGRAIQMLTAQQLSNMEGLAVARIGPRMWRVRDILSCEVLATAATGGDAIRAANAHRFGDAHLTQCR